MDQSISIQARVDNETKAQFILWRDIQRAFGNPLYIRRRASSLSLVSFMVDRNFEDIMPLRIPFHPGEELEVVIEEIAQAYTPRKVAEPMENHNEEPYAPSPTQSVSTSSLMSVNTDLFTTNDQYIPTPDSSPAPSRTNSLRIESHQYTGIVGLQDSMDQLPLGVDRNPSNHDLYQVQLQILDTQHQMKLIQRQSQQELLEKHQQLMRTSEEMLGMQRQALDRLASIQLSLQTLLNQTYELHEYPIPRLFVVLPKVVRMRDKLTNPFTEQYRLYFLCECGAHTQHKNSKTPPEIHFAKHEGYDVDRPTEFFKKYGPYVLAMMVMIKYGIAASGMVIPRLANLKIVNELHALQKNLEYLRSNIAPLVNDTIEVIQDMDRARRARLGHGHGSSGARGLSSVSSELDGMEVVEGADLRQLETFLKVKDKGRVLGNLYRMVTPEGHVKWVCLDHYRINYRDSAFQQLDDTVKSNDGLFYKETGSITIRIASPIQARQFYDAMAKARGVQELDITFGWDATMDDLRAFTAAVTKANVLHLTVDGSHLKRPALDIAHRLRRFEPLLQVTANGRIEKLRLKNFDRFFHRVGGTAMHLSPKLRVLAIESEVPRTGSYFNNLLESCPSLATLELVLSRQSPIKDATADILTKVVQLETLKVDCGKIAITAEVSHGKIQDISMRITRLLDLNQSDLEFINEGHVSHLSIEYTPKTEDENRLTEIVDHNPRLNHLRIGCLDRRCLALISLVTYLRSKSLESGSPHLNTLELMDEKLVPFSDETDNDTKTHIQANITYKEASKEFEMRSWVRLQCHRLVTKDDPICEFVRQYGWSIEVLDAQLTFSDHLAEILDEVTKSSGSRLHKLTVDPHALSTSGVQHVHNIVTRLSSSSTLGVYVEDQEKADQSEKAQALLKSTTYPGSIKPLTRTRSASSRSSISQSSQSSQSSKSSKSSRSTGQESNGIYYGMPYLMYSTRSMR